MSRMVRVPPSAPSVQLRRANTMEPEKVSFVAPGIPRGMITLVSGRPKEGKSLFMAYLAARVSQTAPVIFSNHEDHHTATVIPRLLVAGAAMRRIFIPERPFVMPQDVGALEKRIKQMGAALVVMDAANQHLGPTTGSGQKIRKALTPLKVMLERTGCACVFVDHLVKRTPRGAHPLQALAGAGSGLPAAARFVYVFGRNPNNADERILAPVGVNMGVGDTSWAFELEAGAVVTRDGDEIEAGRLTLVSDTADVDASQVIAFNGGGNAADEASGGLKTVIAGEWLTGVLMFGTKEAKAVCDEGQANGFTWRTLQRAADKISVVRKRQGFGKGSVVMWSLPAGHPALAIAAMMQGQTILPGT